MHPPQSYSKTSHYSPSAMIMRMQQVPQWVHIPLGVLLGVATSSIVLALRAEPLLPNRSDVTGLSAYFVSKYQSASADDMAKSLDECRKECSVRLDAVVSVLVADGLFEIVAANPSDNGVRIRGDPQAAGFFLKSCDDQPGAFQKVSIPRGFDPEFDMLRSECAWLEDTIRSRSSRGEQL